MITSVSNYYFIGVISRKSLTDRWTYRQVAIEVNRLGVVVGVERSL